MLLEFRVKNFRCLRDEQVLSMVASSDKTLLDTNTTPTGIKAIPYTLNSAAIYGANAGGKTTLVRALAVMKLIVLRSAAHLSQAKLQTKIPVTTFLLDAEYASLPVSFEVSFIKQGVRYNYGFSCTSEKILSEFLDVYKTSQPQRWFERTFTENGYTYNFSSHFKGQKKSWQEQTRSDALFLSTAIQLNSDLLLPVFYFFARDLFIVSSLMSFRNKFPILELLYESEDLQKELCEFLREADISIESMNIQKKEQLSQDENHPEEIHTNYEIFFNHSTSKGKATFPLTAESLGTRNLFYLYTPLFMGLESGDTLVIDELDSSLHPLLVKKLVQIYHSKRHNPLGAQLIFTTHDTSLLHGVGNDLLRRDQVWFVEKNEDQASELYSLAEFNATNDKNPERSYFQGRYGGLPFITFDTEE